LLFCADVLYMFYRVSADDLASPHQARMTDDSLPNFDTQNGSVSARPNLLYRK
jgi:hypothetical protein